MTELQLYKFCQDKELEWRCDSLVLWLSHFDIKDFTEFVGYDYFSEGDTKVGLLGDGSIAIELNEICDYFGIEAENILGKEN